MYPASTEIYTLSLHDALPICERSPRRRPRRGRRLPDRARHRRCSAPEVRGADSRESSPRSEEHTSELQSLTNLVCRLLLEKKNNTCNACRPCLQRSPSVKV